MSLPPGFPLEAQTGYWDFLQSKEWLDSLDSLLPYPRKETLFHRQRGKGKKETDFITEGTEGTLLTSLMAVLTTPLNPSSEVGLR